MPATNWARNGWGAGAALHYVGGMTECQNNDCSVKTDGTMNPGHDIDAYFTLDVHASRDFNSFLGKSNFTVGMRNVFDKTPPIFYTTNTVSDTSTYDYLGRFMYVRLTQQF